MKIFIGTIIVMQIALIGLGSYQVTQPELLGFGIFNLVINSLALPFSVLSLKDL